MKKSLDPEKDVLPIWLIFSSVFHEVTGSFEKPGSIQTLEHCHTTLVQCRLLISEIDQKQTFIERSTKTPCTTLANLGCCLSLLDQQMQSMLYKTRTFSLAFNVHNELKMKTGTFYDDMKLPVNSHGHRYGKLPGL